MNLGENIYRLRGEKNMSQGDLADALEVSRQSVSKWENNSATPELDKLIKMSQLFDVSLDELVTRKQPAVPAAPQRKRISVREMIGMFLLCCAVIIFIIFSITAYLGLEGGIYYGLLLASAGAALCWPDRNAVQLVFGILDGLWLIALMLLQEGIFPSLILGIPFGIIYGIWRYLTTRQ